MKKIIKYIILLILAVVFIAPVAVTFAQSISFEGEFLTFAQYGELLITNYTFLYYFWNSMFYSVIITFFCLIISFPLGYLFAKVNFKGSNVIFFVYIAVMMLPFQATLLPNYIQLRDFHLLQTHWALMLPMIFSPFAVFLLRQFMKSIPTELLDYIALETSSLLCLFKHVVFPHVKTAIVALTLIIFCESWNMVEPALIFISENKDIMPASVILNQIPENISFSGAMIYMYPILILFFMFKETLQLSMERYKW